ncbi:hypothetical protein JW998_05280 [candidate division KSB1 bacterium]|nr:hypothetical protein [candidate division KSB1 bacterium]
MKSEKKFRWIAGIIIFLPVEHIGNVYALFRYFAGDLSNHSGVTFRNLEIKVM